MENGKERATIMFLWDYVDNYDDDNCFCRMVERRKELNLLSSRDHSPHWNSSDLHRTWVHILLNPLSQCCPHIEISQMIYSVNQLTSFYMRATLALNRLIKLCNSDNRYTAVPKKTPKILRSLENFVWIYDSSSDSNQSEAKWAIFLLYVYLIGHHSKK